MSLDSLLSTIILVSFLVTILMAVGSYLAYKLRERRRPSLDTLGAGEESLFFERIPPDDVDAMTVADR
jgi:hypothetical protein